MAQLDERQPDAERNSPSSVGGPARIWTWIQSILRHADISTTQAFYILPNRDRAEAGLKKLGVVARKKYGIKA